MKLLFANAHYEPGRASGSRVHIESVIQNIQGLGHEVWVTKDSPSETGRPLPSSWIRRGSLLSRLDAIYCRFEGQTVRLPPLLKIETALWARRVPIVWEFNATSDYTALMWDADGRAVELNRLDHEIARQAKPVRLAICNTHGLADYARLLGIQKTTVIPLGTDPELFHPEVEGCPSIRGDSAELNVVWCGSPEIQWHDIELIIVAAENLKFDSRIRFFLVGKMDRPPGCPDNISIVGEVQRSELPQVLACMDVGLALYREPSWSRFGVYSSPLKLFDYMASSLIVVASPIEQVTKIIDEGSTGFFVPFGDSRALAELLSRLASEKRDVKEAMGTAARDLAVQYYNWSRVAQETVSEIEALS